MTSLTSARPLPSPTVPPLTRTAQFRTALALVSRDVAVLFQNPVAFVVRVSIQPALFSFVFAYVFPRIGFGIGGSC